MCRINSSNRNKAMKNCTNYFLLPLLVCSAAELNVGTSATVSRLFTGDNITSERLTATYFPSEGTAGVVFDGDAMAEAAREFEKLLKSFVREGVKAVANRINFGDYLDLSPKCVKGLMKYIHDLTKVKVWALKMLDATSKLPAGIMEGTLTDFGGFDECLEISVPFRNDSENFRGMYCAIDAAPKLPPPPKNFSTARQFHANPDDSIATEYKLLVNAFHFVHFRLGVCLPSSCTLDDIRYLASKVVNTTNLKVRVPKCYVKEKVQWTPIHFAVMSVLSSLMVLGVVGAFLEIYFDKNPSKTMDSGICRIVMAFSLKNNWRKLISTSKSNGELRVLHGIRFLSIVWVIIGHTYAWPNTTLMRRPSNALVWFNTLEFGAVLNGWLSVEAFFLLSGLLTCYTMFRVMEKTNGQINVPFVVMYRYLRLTPSLLLVMGLVFLLPLMSSGPFWFEYVDPEIESCKANWWVNLIYLGNWLSMSQVCVHPTWFLSADFQLFIISLLVLIMLYRSPLMGLMTLGFLTLSCNVLVGALTYMWELPPTVLVSSGNLGEINVVLDLIHMKTYTHVGPYCVGIVTGYLILRKKQLHLSKLLITTGWCASLLLSLCSVYGLYRWNTGYFHTQLVSSFYAAFHRTALALGVAWVVFACVNGKGGPVNWILSCRVWIPLSRLTFLVYLLHGLVMWTRAGSARDRYYTSHYNALYEYTTTLVIVVAVSVPLYLIVEAPMSQLLRMFVEKVLIPKATTGTEDSAEKQDSNAVPVDAYNGFVSTNVQLTSLQSVRVDEPKTNAVYPVEATNCVQ